MTAGLRFAYVDTAQGQVHLALSGDGPPLLLLPGSARSWRQFAPLLPLLAAHHRVIAVDTLGYGASAPLPPGGTMHTLAESTAAVLDALALPRAHVFGMHTGHKVAAALAAGWPQRVDRLVIAGKTHSLIPDQAARKAAILARVLSRTHLREVDDAREPVSTADWARCFRTISALWWHDTVLAGGEPAAAIQAVRLKIIDELASLPDTGAVYAANFAFDMAAALAQVQAQTLIVEVTHRDEDRAHGRQAAQLAACLPTGLARTAELPSVDETGFACNCDSAALAAVLVQFLNEPLR